MLDLFCPPAISKRYLDTGSTEDTEQEVIFWGVVDLVINLLGICMKKKISH